MRKELLTTAESAKLIINKITGKRGVSVRRVQSQLKQGKYPGAKIHGRDWLIPRSNIDSENKRLK